MEASFPLGPFISGAPLLHGPEELPWQMGEEWRTFEDSRDPFVGFSMGKALSHCSPPSPHPHDHTASASPSLHFPLPVGPATALSSLRVRIYQL